MTQLSLEELQQRHQIRLRVNVSGGVGSTIALHRCLQWFSKDRIIPVFADTGSESKSLYKLLDEIEQGFGITLCRLGGDRDIWQVFFSERFIKDSKTGACKASVELKRKPLARHLQALGGPEEVVVVTGLNFDEEDRQLRLEKHVAPYNVFFPLNENPRLGQCKLLEQLGPLNLSTPEAYLEGYAHNNCNRTCVLAGKSHWAKLYVDDPVLFEHCADKERLFRTTFDREHTILKDRRGGATQSYTLYQLKAEIDAGILIPKEFLSACNCVVPGESERLLETTQGTTAEKIELGTDISSAWEPSP